MKSKVLLFGFTEGMDFMKVRAALAAAQIEARWVGPADYHRTMLSLAEDSFESSAIFYPGNEPVKSFSERFLVLCGLDDRLDEVLPLLRSAGAGKGCLKAVLTETNGAWTPAMLYRELCLEREEFARRAKKG